MPSPESLEFAEPKGVLPARRERNGSEGVCSQRRRRSAISQSRPFAVRAGRGEVSGVGCTNPEGSVNGANDSKPTSMLAVDRCWSTSRLPRKDVLPVIFHADDDPSALFCLIVERLGKGADLGVRQSSCWAIGVFTRRIVMQHNHR